MKLYLMQHGKPVPKEENPEKPLSAQGKNDVERMAEFLQKRGAMVDKIFHSGKSRARQTAEIMTSRLNPEVEPEKKSGLSPMDDVKEMASQINEEEKDLLITGHLPHLAKLASLLITGSDAVPIIRFQQGGVVCLEKGEGGRWTVTWVIIPDLMR